MALRPFPSDLQTREVRALTASDTEAANVSLQWAADGRGLYLACDRGRDFKGLARLDIATGKLTWLATPDWDVEDVRLSPDGSTLAYTVRWWRPCAATAVS